MSEKRSKPKLPTSSIWGDLFTPKPTVDEGLLSSVPQAEEQDAERDAYEDAYWDWDER
jgi:hypothetical protein